jgi:ribitol-5-phosphate 2-dehydrogenase (NADP+)
MVARACHTAVAFRLTQPFQIEATEHEASCERADDVLVRPRLTGVCASDLKLYAGTRDRRALSKKLPLALLHEGVAEVVEAGRAAGLRRGTPVVVVPNVPCYIAHPERYPSRSEACLACQPGGAGENYCLENLYLSSNTDGLAQTIIRHPAPLCLPIPAGVPDRVAVLTEPLTTIVAGCEKAPITPDARCLVLGNGPLGHLVAICLTAFHGVPRQGITMTGHDWEHRPGAQSVVGRVIDAEDGASLAELAGRIDIAFECVGSDANQDTLEQAVECLRPGGTAVLFGPSERSFLFNTREVIGKGLTFLGANRSYVPHFHRVMARLVDPGVQALLGTVLSPTEFWVRTAHDLNHALYHAWTKRDAGKTVIGWAGPE